MDKLNKRFSEHLSALKWLKFSLVVVAFSYITGCGLLDNDGDPEISLGHSISIRNYTSEDLFVDFSVVNRKIDTTATGVFLNIDRVRLDSSYTLESGRQALLIQDDYTSNARDQFSLREIADKVNFLNVYKIQGSDTLTARIDLLDESNWSHDTNDPITFERTIHFYTLAIKENHF